MIYYLLFNEELAEYILFSCFNLKEYITLTSEF